eukprot:TRINITY_DN3030_c0_g1_i5.p1 TRINITY_DN3030_c0_g1~~TRINITY_DN3030_c0_g1_i5.p1  ORF type:complete len:534 (-),score=101.65 TRINITY_DN3030_c0_g1_i5:187-1554(-)
MQALPCLLQERDILASAPTGSGKTLAFLLPLLQSILTEKNKQNVQNKESSDSDNDEDNILRAVIISPTKELSAQTQRVLNWLSEGTGIQSALLNKTSMAELRKADILLGSPLKLARFVYNNKLDFSQIKYLILDEADKLFSEETHKRKLKNKKQKKKQRVREMDILLDEDDEEMNQNEEEKEEENEEEKEQEKVKEDSPLKAGSEFYRQILGVLQKCRENENVVVALFSATLPEMVELAAREFLIDPIRISVGLRNAAATTIKQSLRFVGNESGKLLALRQILIDGGLKPPIIVFVESKERAQGLYEELKYDKVHVDCIHSDQSQGAREIAVDKFRSGGTWVMIATELLGRGMDFVGINTVINYDFPRSTLEYVHRIGRTGRAGREGEAITFFTYDNLPELRPVANLMKEAGCEVPDWMLEIKKIKQKPFNKPALKPIKISQKRKSGKKQQSGQQ